MEQEGVWGEKGRGVQQLQTLGYVQFEGDGEESSLEIVIFVCCYQRKR